MSYYLVQFIESSVKYNHTFEGTIRYKDKGLVTLKSHIMGFAIFGAFTKDHASTLVFILRAKQVTFYLDLLED